MLKNNIKNKIYLCFITMILIVCYSFNSFAQLIDGDEIWMGWASNEYNAMGYGAVANNFSDEKLKIDGYGRYQFRYNTNLVDFLNYADSDYFKRWIEFGKGSQKLNDYNYGLQRAFSTYYSNNKDRCKEIQDNYLYEKYYYEAKKHLLNSGVDLSNMSMYVKGAVFSFVCHKFNKNEVSQVVVESSIADIVPCFDEDERKTIENIYNMLIDRYTADDYEKSRWASEREACLNGSDDTFDSHVGEILTANGTLNMSFISELNKENPTILAEFLSRGKFFTTEQKEWYDSVRNSIDFNKDANIYSGTLDFSVATTKGIKMANYIDLINEDAVMKEINNGTGIYYIPQNADKEYAKEKFGSNNVAQGGGSLACLSMAINKLLGKRDSNLITPDKICEKLVANHGDVNFYYNEEKKGQENKIIADVANMYGLQAELISADSVISSLMTNKLVIARVSASEFTKTGNFVLIAAAEAIDGKVGLKVIDPNIYHARFMYSLYSLDYLKDDCEGIFFEIKM